MQTELTINNTYFTAGLNRQCKPIVCKVTLLELRPEEKCVVLSGKIKLILNQSELFERSTGVTF